MLKLTGTSAGQTASGFYLTNSTYAANSMRDGDAFGKKFGGATGNDPDFFKLTIRNYYGGVMTNDSVVFYLADYRFSNNAQDYILKTWEWVNLAPLGNIDSLVFQLTSSDVGSFGMNTPAYFAMDNFTANQLVGVVENTVNKKLILLQNPITDNLLLQYNSLLNEESILEIFDVSGKLIYIKRYSLVAGTNIVSESLATIENGIYFVSLTVNESRITKKIVKQ
jgi:hypothetical protein